VKYQTFIKTYIAGRKLQVYRTRIDQSSSS